ncbi:MAG: WbuC family cupin fold metalloprotein [Bacteroidales bacterium]|nr:WbuC family cupin fold metalloprotein [Bacteroidales bacterium]
MIISNELMDELLVKAATSERRRINLDLRNSEQDTSQRMLNALMPDTVVPMHRHTATAETIVLLKGRVTEILFNDEFVEIQRIDLDKEQGNVGLQIPTGIWHTIIAHEPSVIIEMKDGAYAPLTSSDVKPIR